MPLFLFDKGEKDGETILKNFSTCAIAFKAYSL